MANAKVIIGATGGEIRISEGPGSTGATGFGTLYVSSSDNKPHFVDTNGTDSVLGGELQKFGALSLYTPGVGSNLSAASGDCYIAIGANTIIAGANCNYIAIGPGAKVCAGADYGGGMAIGYNAQANRYAGIALGANANAGQEGLAIGVSACTSAYGYPTAIGLQSCALGPRAIAIGQQSRVNAAGDFSGVAIGYGAFATCCNTVSMGRLACTAAHNAVAIGTSSISNHTGAVVLGPSLTSERANTVHVNNLLALGQGVSKGHDIGATAGSVAIDWNNSNTQKVTMTGNITALSLSNPIQGGVYSLIVEQGNTSANTITWPTGAIKWPGGTPPTLTTGATGSTDIISLIYDPAGGTAYYGNSNANFS